MRKETITRFSEIHTKLIDALCGKSVKFCTLDLLLQVAATGI